MAYNDELGTVLDRLSRSDLIYFSAVILRENRQKMTNLGTHDLRRKCSKELRMAGHSLCNVWRDHHALPYIEIVRDVSKKAKVRYDKNDDVLIIERKIIDEQVRVLWDKSDESDK